MTREQVNKRGILVTLFLRFIVMARAGIAKLWS
jgi:hypothetical protein